jgi:Putative MetA-pathway of phenol degradation
MKRFSVGIFVVLLGSVALLRAGPPYMTDDPEPVEYQHWEVYLATQTTHVSDSTAGTLPHVEVNYGVIPNVQLHVIAPLAFSSSSGSSRNFGYGDTELGIKYRFQEETASTPQLGIFPIVELPTGSTKKDLGSGHTQVFLPLWIQKKIGEWTTYGGGGYWLNPGTGNQNYWLMGWMIQNQITKTLALGAEVYHTTPQEIHGASNTVFNLGLVWDLSEEQHILASAGPRLSGPKGYQTYLAYQLTFGPVK